MFTGKFEYSIDDKGRVSVPARIRSLASHQGQPDYLFLTPGPKGNLNAYTQAGFDRYIEQLSAGTGSAASDLLRYVTSKTDNVAWDKQGRVIINDQLKAHAGISRDVVILGVGSRIELWDKKRFDSFESKQEPAVTELFNNAKLPADLL